jgi:uncharacterized membrane protein YkgB
MSSLIKIMAKSRLFNSDLDYHLVRASMVIIYLLFGYQKWWEYEAHSLVPFISNGPLLFLDVSRFRYSRGKLVPGCFGMGHRRTAHMGLLE